MAGYIFTANSQNKKRPFWIILIVCAINFLILTVLLLARHQLLLSRKSNSEQNQSNVQIIKFNTEDFQPEFQRAMNKLPTKSFYPRRYCQEGVISGGICGFDLFGEVKNYDLVNSLLVVSLSDGSEQKVYLIPEETIVGLLNEDCDDLYRFCERTDTLRNGDLNSISVGDKTRVFISGVSETDIFLSNLIYVKKK